MLTLIAITSYNILDKHQSTVVFKTSRHFINKRTQTVVVFGRVDKRTDEKGDEKRLYF